ncbi:hypothetical protein XCR1_940056 [Xenorhabdus cabanillasii JM26]|uniref:Uncharacterized protein n=1 Tax=Xenorhabdus cabanillasii JM26 TaxID=1427517 RepID=W1JCR9_9GAMM|nr:hypothetical protein XCR1_940056 [Xenorhabdus cabanillasii JM26]
MLQIHKMLQEYNFTYGDSSTLSTKSDYATLLLHVLTEGFIR